MALIVQKNNPILRSLSREVKIEEISSPYIKKVIADMKEALASQDDGVAIAAPQIGELLRIFIVSGKVLHFMKGEPEEPRKYPDMIFINPVITKLSKEKKYMEEGCLSVRYLYGKVNRSTKAHIEAYDENGDFFKRGGSGLLAQIFQHETDHLNGILFIDSAIDVEDLPPEKLKARSRSQKHNHE